MYFLTDWARRIDFDRLRQERGNRLQKKMAEYSLDALIVFRVENVKYATDIHPSWFPSVPIRNAAVIKGEGSFPIGFVASGNLKHRQATSYWMDPGHMYPMPLMESRAQVQKVMPSMKKAFETLGIKGGKIGVDLITPDILAALKQTLPQALFVAGEECLNEARLIKNNEEMKCLRVSSACVEVAMDVAQKAIDTGNREGEILGEGMYEMYRLGMQMHQGIPFVSSGEENLFPLTRFATDRFLRDGDLVVLSFGGYFNGMFAEMKRTFICGKPHPLQKKIYCTVFNAMEKALEILKPGASSHQMVQKIREIFAQNGYGSHLNQPLAHGIGVGGWEPPYIEAESPDFVFETGMVVSLDAALMIPGIPGGGSVFLGNMVAVQESGNEVLTHGMYDKKLLN
jgi:Xaa-Pro aminopeptidase